ncbi:MAG: helix-turn-helix domain-containing protein [Nanoarchaeota archaeon]
MEIKEKLREAGLTENESKVYEALLRLGPNHAGIISRKTGLHRRVVYDTTEMLIQKGLIGYILKNNKRLFQASDPERILEIIKEKEENINEIMPSMRELFKTTKEKEETNFYKGKNGLKTVFEDQIQTKKEIQIIGASFLAYDILQFYFKWFDKRRVQNKIKTRIIFNNFNNKKLRIPLAEIRYLPEKYSSPLAINIYGDKVAIILWSKENPFAILIKDKAISKGYKKHFELIWKISKPIKKIKS